MLAVLEADRIRVADLQARVVQLERVLSQLRTEQLQAQERLDSYKYPILTLPVEITSEIFMHLLPPYPDFPKLIGPFSPTSLTQICRSWRAIALGIPKLWSIIAFDDDSEEWEPSIFETWLRRSRSRPLSIRLESLAWTHDKLVEAMMPHRARWDYLKIEFDEDENLRILDAPMPLLRHLELTMEEADQDPVYPIALHGDTVGPQQQPDIILQCLESLVLSDDDDCPVTDFLPTFVVPALRSLTVPEEFLAPNTIDCLESFISKSGCTLLNLHLTGARSVPARAYRKAFPSLPKLSFSSTMYNDDEDSMASDSDS
ncbi:hypothetical protein DFH06DRAFT_1340291 [Mycena polygramma]|nr:hypothetical protein DFH06DRAFT_1340291 [Mycena polygramma]